MAAYRTGFGGAMDRLEVLVDYKATDQRLARMASRAPEAAKKALAQAVQWWHRQAVRHVPVRGAIGTYSQTGRGQLRKRTLPYINASSDEVEGGVRSMMDYAIWLLAGTRYIAGGAVMQWRPGDPLVTSWPAKDDDGGSPSGAMPILVPWLEEARDRFVEGVEQHVFTWR